MRGGGAGTGAGVDAATFEMARTQNPGKGILGDGFLGAGVLRESPGRRVLGKAPRKHKKDKKHKLEVQKPLLFTIKC